MADEKNLDINIILVDDEDNIDYFLKIDKHEIIFNKPETLDYERLENFMHMTNMNLRDEIKLFNGSNSLTLKFENKVFTLKYNIGGGDLCSKIKFNFNKGIESDIFLNKFIDLLKNEKTHIENIKNI